MLSFLALLVSILLNPGSVRAISASNPTDDSGIRTIQRHPMSSQSELTEDRSATKPYAKGQIIVRFKDNVAEPAMTLANAQNQGVSARKFSIVKNLHLVQLPADADVKTAIEAYKKNPDVLYAEPNYIVEAFKIPKDPMFSSQWNMKNTGQNGGTLNADIHASRAWGLETGDRSVVVAVIDTGVDYNHHDLAPNMWRNSLDCNNNGIDDDGNGYIDDCHGINTLTNASDPMDDFDHGTHVAGIIGAVGNNNLGVSGINWKVSIMACKFLDAEGYGTEAGAIACMEYVSQMKDRGINIVATNNSWGGFSYSQALFEAISSHQKRGILYIAAAGNDMTSNDYNRVFPSSYQLSNVISVAATDRFDTLSPYYSNYGRYSVLLGSPGTEILSTVRNDQYDVFSGTSMSTPHVTGAAALIKANKPSEDWRGIKNLILTSGNSIAPSAKTVTGKRLNTYRALACSDSVVLSRLKPAGNAVEALVGVPLELSVLHINCAHPNGEIIAHIVPGDTVVTLHDDGIGPDQVAGDGIYSAMWKPVSQGIFTLEFPSNDRVAVRVVGATVKQLFTNPVSFALGHNQSYNQQATAIGDLNGDGRNDVALITGFNGSNEKGLFIFYQDNSGQLITPPLFIQVGAWTSATESIDIGDLNNDGRMDVAVTSYDTANAEESFVGVFLQDQSGQLGPMVKYKMHLPRRVKIGDVNHDGLNDIVSVGRNSDAALVRILLQKSNGTLASPIKYEVPFDHFYNVDVAIGDVNNDGLNDIIILGIQGPSCWPGHPVMAMLYQKADGTFSSPDYRGEWLICGVEGMAVGDVNGDKMDDIVVSYGNNTDRWPGPYIATFLQGSTGIARSDESYQSYDVPTSLAIADVDGDGRNDVLVSHNGWVAMGIYKQAPNGELFPYHLAYLPGDNFNPHALSVGDVNGDGRPDVAYASPCCGLVMLYGKPRIGGEVDLDVIMGGNGKGTITSSPKGMNCTFDGYRTRCIGYFAEGSRVTLIPVPAAGSVFSGWRPRGGGCEENADGTATCALKFNQSLQADFSIRSEQLIVSKVGTGRGTITSTPSGIQCGDTCSGAYDYGTEVTLQVIPEAGSVFKGWSGACKGTLTACTITMADTKYVAVEFDDISPPTLGLLTPANMTSGVGLARKFSAVYNDADGYADLKTVDMRVGPADGVIAIWLRYDQAANKVYLFNDDGTKFVGGCTPGTAGKISNTYGTLNCGRTTITRVDTALTVNWGITPMAAIVSKTPWKISIMAKDNANQTSGWGAKGTWTIHP